jgi:uncharacterized surface protein with fasciclin (FAS1) repeats
MKRIIAATAIAAFALAATLSGPAIAGKGHSHADKDQAMSIYKTARDAGFTTLVAAVDAAGLAETLDTKGPFTVFAPTDEAFAALPEGALEGLLADKDALTNVLLYHVVDGEVMAKDVVKVDAASMLNGATAPVKVEKNTVTIAGVKVVKTDIKASNGVIHVIDAVMIPGDEQASNR